MKKILLTIAILTLLISFCFSAGKGTNFNDVDTNSALNYIFNQQADFNNVNVAGSLTIQEGALSDSSITSSDIKDSAVTKNKLNYETVNVTISAGNNTGTASVTPGSVIVGYYPIENQDQFVSNISITDGNLTITLKDNATANNKFRVFLIK